MSSTFFVDEHLIMNIVSRLPVESVFQCRCVCKTWRALLHEPYFTQIHTHRLPLQQRHTVSFFRFVNIPNTNNYEYHIQDCYYDDDDDDDDEGKWKRKRNSSSSSSYSSSSSSSSYSSVVDLWLVIGSINGLICFYLNPSSFSIYNPILGEYLNLLTSLDSDDRGGSGGGGVAIGFGYHPSTNQYKIVRIIHRGVTSHGNYFVRWVQIYTLGSGKWRVSKEMGQTSFSGAGVYVNIGGGGAIYWLDALGKIVSFDLEDEKFRIIPTPSSPTARCIGYQLGELAGVEGLCAIERSNVGSTNIYTMNNNNNNNDGKCLWSKKFSIPVMAASDADIQYKPIAVTRKGRVLCLCNKRFLISFDPITETIETLGDVTCVEGWSPIVSYTKSFVSLKSLGEEDAQIVKPGGAKKKRRRGSIDMKTEMIKLFTSLLQNWFVD